MKRHPRTAFSLNALVVALPLAMGGSDTQCDAACRRLDVIRADLRMAELDVGRWCGPDELLPLVTNHATLLQLDRTFAELRANSALDEEKLAELQNMLMRLVGNLATVEFAVPRPDLQQPLRTPIGDTVPRMHQANNGTETSRTIDDWQPHTHQDGCRHPLLSQLQCTYNALAMHLQCVTLVDASASWAAGGNPPRRFPAATGAGTGTSRNRDDKVLHKPEPRRRHSGNSSSGDGRVRFMRRSRML